mmetsp:Transcript_43717/g.92992  ORF Transcript_43717/g.92992 Transcript_43717/m.92992 type:complete len:182 (-) Transcript_43717:186-731(-)
MQGVLHSVRCTALRVHGSAAGRRGLGVHMHMRDPRHRGRLQLEVRVRAQRHAAATSVGFVSLGMCAPQGAVQEGGQAGCEEGELGEHAAIAEEPAVLCAVLPCCLDSLAATSREAVGKLSLGARHTARRRLRRAGLWRSREPGSLEPGAMWQRALRTPSPLLLRRESAVVGRGHGCGQRTR